MTLDGVAGHLLLTTLLIYKLQSLYYFINGYTYIYRRNKMSDNLIKQAEQNVLNICKEMELAIDALDAFKRFGNRALKDYISKPKFFEGLELMFQAVRQEYVEQISRCFALSGVGGKESHAYAKSRAKDYFGGNYEIMSFLDRWGAMGSYKSDLEKEFKTQLKNAIKEEK